MIGLRSRAARVEGRQDDRRRLRRETRLLHLGFQRLAGPERLLGVLASPSR